MLPRRSSARARRRFSFSLAQLLNRLFYTWETEIFNDYIYLYGHRYSSVLRHWFNLGIGFGLITMIIVLLVLIWSSSWLVNLGNQNNATQNSRESRHFVTLVVPGINVPWSDLGYILFGTILAVGFHEFGHALAATSEGVHIEHVAVFVACLFPGALVALNHDSLQIVSSIRALRIYCAGIWHNGVCCAGCCLLLMLLPLVLHPFYFHSKNPVVLDVPAKSPLAGHLSPGNIILKVGGLQPHSPEDWIQDLQVLSFQDLSHYGYKNGNARSGNVSQFESSGSITRQQGFCVPKQNLDEKQTKMTDSNCSDEEFPFFEMPCSNANSDWPKAKPDNTRSQPAFCLKARDVVRYPVCGQKQMPTIIADPCTCSENGICMLPELHDGNLLIEITFRDSSAEGCSLEVAESGTNSEKEACQQSLVFLGDPLVLAYSMQLTNYWPRSMSFFGLFSVSFLQWFPGVLESLFTYTFYVSAAMALLNSAPVFYLDGELILQTWLSLSMRFMHPRKRRQVLHIFLTVGSILLVFFMVSGLLNALF